MRQSTGQASQRTMPAPRSASESAMSSLISSSFLPRHTGQRFGRSAAKSARVSAQRTAGENPTDGPGKFQIGNWPTPRLRLSPSGPSGHLPRKTGEEEIELLHADDAATAA